MHPPCSGTLFADKWSIPWLGTELTCVFVCVFVYLYSHLNLSLYLCVYLYFHLYLYLNSFYWWVIYILYCGLWSRCDNTIFVFVILHLYSCICICNFICICIRGTLFTDGWVVIYTVACDRDEITPREELTVTGGVDCICIFS